VFFSLSNAQVARDAGEQVGLITKMDSQAGDLSGGQKRKLSVAIAFLGDPAVVLIDVREYERINDLTRPAVVQPTCVRMCVCVCVCVRVCMCACVYMCVFLCRSICFLASCTVALKFVRGWQMAFVVSLFLYN
jgi:hypothetical protein